MKYLKYVLFIVLAAALSNIINAQDAPKPKPSPLCKISQDIALTNVTIEYSRPGAKGRKIFGGLVPFDKVWRTGANAATKITLKQDATIGGKDIPARDYSIYTIPGENEWTVMFNNKLDGGMNYPEGDDQIRFQVKPEKLTDFVETFTIEFSDITDTSANIVLSWENTKVKFPIVFKTGK